MSVFLQRAVFIVVYLAISSFMTAMISTAFAETPEAKKTAPSVADAKDRISHLDEIWKVGKNCEYFIEAEKCSVQIGKIDDKAASASLAAELLDKMLSKKVDINEYADHLLAAEDHACPESVASDLSVMSALADDIMRPLLWKKDVVPPEIKRKNVKILARLLGKIRNEQIPNYQPKPRTMNVSPPIPSGEFMFAGMDPDAIKDQKAKAAYKAAIRKNEINGLLNFRQQQLSECISGPLASNFIDYIFATFCSQEQEKDASLFNECVKLAQLTDKEIRLLKNRLVEDHKSHGKKTEKVDQHTTEKDTDDPFASEK